MLWRRARKTKCWHVLCLFLALILGKTVWDVHTPALSLQEVSNMQRFHVRDRHGTPLGISYQSRLNTAELVPLYDIPPLLRDAFITSEDRRFFSHGGVDWKARFGALHQSLRARRFVRGASTITEQVVRILHPRPRTLWSRWVEGFEAYLLESNASKGEILEFYLNQVPYAANRRGVAQAARYYFNRDIKILTPKEMLALAILPRAPSSLDLYRDAARIEPAMRRLAEAMIQRGELDTEDQARIFQTALQLAPAEAPPNAMHFVHYIREVIPYQLSEQGVLHTTLDAHLQRETQTLLDTRIAALAGKKVHNGAVLVADHITGEILAWAVAGANTNNAPGSAIDMVRMPRQPGSSLKPFLYAQALDLGWTPATRLDDEPMSEAIGAGLHDFHNYSHSFYGPISLREALGNSLNIPALQTIRFVTPELYLRTLHRLGFESLSQPATFYNDGLALGNGEVSLFELVQAYATLANRGTFRPLTPLPQPPYLREQRRIYSEEAASLIGHILSDPFARRLEFGAASILNLPVQTAVKTGTSTDYHDAWVIGYNARYVVGVWLGNADRTPMDGVTGSTGPALILRSVFAELNHGSKPAPLYLSPKLEQREVCSNYKQQSGADCFPRTEYFIAGTARPDVQTARGYPKALKLIRPTKGLQLAYDPRIPASAQEFEFVAIDFPKSTQLEWQLNGRIIAKTEKGRLLWPVKRGEYQLQVKTIDTKGKPTASDTVHFKVK